MRFWCISAVRVSFSSTTENQDLPATPNVIGYALHNTMDSERRRFSLVVVVVVVENSVF